MHIRQEEYFLKALREDPNAARAIRMAGLTSGAVYHRRRTDPAFAAAWDGALQEAEARQLELALARRDAELQCQRQPKKGQITPEQLEIFLNALREEPHVTRARIKARIRQGAIYEKRNVDTDFAIAWNEALREGQAKRRAAVMEARQLLESEPQVERRPRRARGIGAESNIRYYVVEQHLPLSEQVPPGMTLEEFEKLPMINIEWPKD